MEGRWIRIAGMDRGQWRMNGWRMERLMIREHGWRTAEAIGQTELMEAGGKRREEKEGATKGIIPLTKNEFLALIVGHIAR